MLGLLGVSRGGDGSLRDRLVSVAKFSYLTIFRVVLGVHGTILVGWETGDWARREAVDSLLRSNKNMRRK